MCQVSPEPTNTVQDQLYDANRRAVIYATAVGEAIGGLRAMSYFDDAKECHAVAARLLQGLTDRLEELDNL